MKEFSFKKAVIGCSVLGIAALMTSNALAQVYYPVEIQVTNPAGAPESYTMYIPGEVQQGISYQQQQVAITNANGVTEYQTIYVPATQQSLAVSSDGSYELSSNPWDDSASAPVQNVAVASASAVKGVLNNSASNAALQSTLSQQTAALTGISSANTVAAAPVSSTRLLGNNSSGGTTSGATSTTSSTSENLRDMALPTWVGQNTTYNTAYGQEMIAPEINKTNMLSMVQHLRKLGYIVPDSLDTAIAEAPSKTKVKMIEAVHWIQNGGDNNEPILKALAKVSKDLESNYGFSFENILGTSLNILDAR